jgi:hypothetical protein
MNDNDLLIVGNDYAGFADLPNVLTLSGFLQKANDVPDWPQPGSVAVIGQGVGLGDREFIGALLAQRQVHCPNGHQPLATLAETHKRSEENVLITRPVGLGEHFYGSELVITDKVDRLSDHVTGRHVGAMLLIEAARQATIAALELSFPGTGGARYGLILERLDSSFGGYVFPLPASLRTEVRVRTSAQSSIAATVVTTVTQCGSEVAALTLDVTLCVESTLGKLEARKAQAAVRRFDSGVAPRAEVESSLAVEQ